MPSKPSFKCALITGATSGLGMELAKVIASKVPTLLITGRDQSKLEALKASLPCETHAFALDLTDRSHRSMLIKEIHSFTPDLVINNAGFGLYGPATTLSTEEQLQMLEVNIAALVEITLESAKALISKKTLGTILNISSAAAFYIYPTFAAYSASKAFVSSFSQSLHTELKSQNIHVLTACPGQIATDFRKRAAKGKPQKKDPMAMSVEKAALYLWQQIEQKKPFSIFDARYRLLVFLSRFIPSALLQRYLKNSLKDRY